MDIISTYTYTITAIGSLAFLMLVQFLIADIAGIRSKHLPGSTVSVDHKDFLFRATRSVANTNESIAIFILAIIFCILSNASPLATSYAAWAFVIARFFYALCYYFNIKIMRSIIFGISLLALTALLIIGLLVWL